MSILRHTAKLSVFFLVLCLTISSLFVVSIIFSVVDFQRTVARLAPETGGIVRFAEINVLDAQVTLLENQTAPQRGEAIQLAQYTATAKQDLENARDRLGAEQVRALVLTGALEETSKIPVVQEFGAFDAESLSRRLDKVAASPDGAALKSSISEVRDAISKSRTLENEIDALETSYAARQRELLRANEFLETTNRAVLGLQGQFGTQFGRVRNEARAMVGSTPFGLGGELSEMHPTFLLTVLTAMMGGLGALLFLIPAFLTDENSNNFLSVFIRLLFGMFAGLVTYVTFSAAIPRAAEGTILVTGSEAAPLVAFCLGAVSFDLVLYLRRRVSFALSGVSARRAV